MPKNTYNVGFLYGFSEKYITKILVNLQKKKNVKNKYNFLWKKKQFFF